jgi:hypothetical protein
MEVCPEEVPEMSMELGLEALFRAGLEIGLEEVLEVDMVSEVDMKGLERVKVTWRLVWMEVRRNRPVDGPGSMSGRGRVGLDVSLCER